MIEALRALLGILAATVVVSSALGQESPLPPVTPPTLRDLAKAKQNPFTTTINVPIQTITGFGIAPSHNVGEQFTIQPLIPNALDGNWNLIVRPLVPVTYLPEPQGRFGLGDIQSSFFLTPARTGPLTWGFGPAVQLPTATSNELGSGKWSVGPTGALIYSEGPWFAGVLVTQLWSVAGGNRKAVNQTTTEIDFSYNFASGWYIQIDPTITYNGAASASEAWTVPIGFDVGKVMKVNGQNLSFQLGTYKALRYPTGTPAWIVRAEITLLFAK
jgi:hypothetical protein